MQTLIAALASYIGTNLDDLLVLTFLYSRATTGRSRMQILLGKYLGITALVLISILGAQGVGLLPKRITGLLGIVPILLGLRTLLIRKTGEDGEAGQEGSLLLGTAAVTVANGADNVGVYVPLFAGYSLAEMLTVFAVFSVMTALWCLLGRNLSMLPFIKKRIEKHGRILVPLIYVALGIYIFIKSYWLA